MISWEEIKKHLPQYLTEQSMISLFDELDKFPDNIDSRLYTSKLQDDLSIYQGDGFANLLCVNLPNPEAKPLDGMILSNTCDINEDNKRLFDSRLAYVPIFNLEKYKQALIDKFVKSGEKLLESIITHIDDIRKQKISQIFYLPKGGKLENESFVFLDRINNLPSSYFKEDKIIVNRIFTLSDYGFYIFLFKLSVHFTRIRESVQRS